MPDIIDDAQRHEGMFLAHAMANRQTAAQEPQLIIDGVVCCADCEEPIALARLQRVPTATRCVGCQEEAENNV